MTLRRRWAIVVILLLVLALPAALLTSETALRVLADAVSQRVTALEIENLRGTLLTGVSADRVTWRDDARATVIVTGLSARWDILPALAGRLHLDRVEATSVLVALGPARAPADERPRRTIRLPERIEIPLVIRIGELAVGVVTIARAGNTLFEVVSVDGADLYADPDSFRAGRLAATGDPASFELSGTVEPAGAWQTTLESRWRVQLPERPRLDGTLAIDGALDGTLAVTAAAESAEAGTARFSGTMRGLLSDPSADGRLLLDGAVIRRWAAGAPEALVSADVELEGWLRDLGVRGTATVAMPAWPRATIDAEVHWGQQLLAVRRAAVRSDEVATTVDAVGHFDWSAEDPAGNLRASWRALRWPLDDADGLRSDAGELIAEFANGTARAEVEGQFGESDAGNLRGNVDLQWLDAEAQPRVDAAVEWQQLSLAGVVSDHGRASVQGMADDWAGAVVGVVEPPGVPMLTLSAEAAGDRESLRASDVHADWLDGTVDGTVALSWADGLRGDAALVLAGIDPGGIRPAWRGRIGGDLQAVVATENGRTRWTAQLRDGTGAIGERTFGARAELAGVDTDLRRIDAAAHIGDAEATVRGAWTPEIEVTWAVSAPDLGVLVPGAHGAFRGEGFVRGDAVAPAFGFEVAGDALRYGSVSAARLAGDGEIDLAGERATRASLRVDALDLDGRTIDTVALTVSGPPDTLTIGLDAQADALSARARVTGAWDEDAFAGRLEVAELVEAGDTPWQLGAPAALLAGSEAFHLDEACWRQSETTNELCVAGGWRAAEETRFQATLAGLPLAELSEWLPLGFQYSGRISGNASLVWPAGGEPTGEGRLSVTEGAWRQLVGEEAVALLQWNVASIEGALREGDLDAAAGFELVDGGTLDASLLLPVFDTRQGPASGRRLRARIEGGFSDFDLLPALVPDIGSVSGQVRADLTVTGTLDEPLFDGALRIDDGTATVPRLGIRLTALGLAVSGNRNELALRGGARSGEGAIEFDGTLGVRDGRLAGEFTLRGEDFEAADIPEAQVTVSPELTVGIAGHTVDVQGEVRIPFARLSPRDFGGAVTVSEDEILVDEEAIASDGNPWRISSRVRIVMGDVSFTGFGLNGDITGSLTAIDVPDQLTRATGELQIRDGRYEAWGQNLDIEYGRLIFTGGPITEPGVDVLAVRNPQNVTVGVNVRGTLRNPELRLHSEPAMTQSEQLSWLVLGTPLSGATGSEQALVDRTRNTAGLAGGDFIARQLGHRLGLSDVGIDRGDSPDEAALVIGHYLSPRLYIGYGIGIFDPANSLRLRYHLDDHWSIEAETGDRATSTDLRFTIEK